MRSIRTTVSIGASALVMALATTPVLAQDAADDSDSNENPEIVVTAQFRSQNLQDTPIAITAVNAAMLEARGQTDVSQIAAQAPNVTLQPLPQNSGIGLLAFIRGVGQTDFNYALEPGVGIYVDDVYIPTMSSSLLELMDLERVEVLRGPQGTLAGKNSIGGAIKLFSQRPRGTNTGSIQATYGSYNRIDVRGTADVKISDTLSMRLSGLTKNTDGYVKMLDYGLTHPTSNVPANQSLGRSGEAGELGGRNVAAARIAFRWEPTSQLEVNLSADYTRENSDPGAEVLLYANNPATTPDGIPWLVGKNGSAVPFDCRFVPYGANSCDTTPAGYDPRFISYANFMDARTPTSQAPYKPYFATPQNSFRGWGVHGNVSYDLSDAFNVVWISSYREYDMKFAFDQDGSPVPVAQLNNVLKHHAWSQEVRLNGKLADGKLLFTLGGFYFDQNGNYQARVDLNYAGIDFIHGPDTTPSTSKALFFNGTFKPTDAWTLSAGVRYSEDKKDYTYFRSNPDGTVPFSSWTPAQLPFLPICEFFQGAPTAGPTGIGNTPNCLLSGLYGLTDGFKGHRWDWRVVTDYRFSDEFMAYASVATGYKGGGVNPRPFFGPSAGECDAVGYVAPAPCNQLKPFRPESMTTYELGFKADLLDRKVRLNGAVFLNKYKDIILTLTACPSIPCLQPRNVGKADVKGFELEAVLHPAKGLRFDGSLSYLDFEYKSTGTSGVPLSAITPFTPKWNYSFGAQYDHELGSGDTVSARFDGSYRGSIYTEAFNTAFSRTPSYFLGNAKLWYRNKENAWQVTLEVNNLFDRYYYISKSDVSTSLGAVTALPGLPRTWAVTVKKDF